MSSSHATNKETIMPRKKNSVNKSALVREFLARNPKAPVKEIVSTLKQQRNIELQPSLVYYIKSKMKRKQRREKRQRAIEAGHHAGVSNPVQLILEVRRLAEKAGGIRHLKELVDLLAM
jgi:hypothetical protein